MAKEQIETNEVKVENKEDKEKKEGIDYEDEEILTPENKKILKKLIKTEGWEIVTKMKDELVKTAEEEMLKQMRNYGAVKSHGYTIYDIQGAWLKGLETIPEILEAIEKEDEVKRAVDEVAEAEQQRINNL